MCLSPTKSFKMFWGGGAQLRCWIGPSSMILATAGGRGSEEDLYLPQSSKSLSLWVFEPLHVFTKFLKPCPIEPKTRDELNTDLLFRMCDKQKLRRAHVSPSNGEAALCCSSASPAGRWLSQTAALWSRDPCWERDFTPFFSPLCFAAPLTIDVCRVCFIDNRVNLSHL